MVFYALCNFYLAELVTRVFEILCVERNIEFPVGRRNTHFNGEIINYFHFQKIISDIYDAIIFNLINEGLYPKRVWNEGKKIHAKDGNIPLTNPFPPHPVLLTKSRGNRKLHVQYREILKSTWIDNSLHCNIWNEYKISFPNSPRPKKKKKEK